MHGCASATTRGRGALHQARQIGRNILVPLGARHDLAVEQRRVPPAVRQGVRSPAAHWRHHVPLDDAIGRQQLLLCQIHPMRSLLLAGVADR